jgi:membrane-bound metal-dependent hydrolase YbcI (DUF457 family)
MFVLGHLGIGLQVAKPVRRGLPLKPLLLGTLLPDLIDKSMFYGLWLTDRHGYAAGVISGTRTLGHTLLFTGSLAALAAARRSKVLAALALGCATHLFLDVVTDVVTRTTDYSLQVLAWPFLGWRFPGYFYSGFGEHLSRIRQPFFIATELLGALFLILEWRRVRLRR